MSKDIESLLLQIVAHAGEANSRVYDAIDAYEEKGLDAANDILKEAEDLLLAAHKMQFELINKEANGEEVTPSILMIHAMDIFMNASNSIQYTRRMLNLFEKKLKG